MQDPTRPHAVKPPHIYSFDRVFPPSTSQSAFFTTTTLPLVEKVLRGENGLLFAYGVSNSGKSYTISGGQKSASEDRGVLPRAIDVVFNSISGMESKANVSEMILLEGSYALSLRTGSSSWGRRRTERSKGKADDRENDSLGVWR